jgi:hypothetical protein
MDLCVCQAMCSRAAVGNEVPIVDGKRHFFIKVHVDDLSIEVPLEQSQSECKAEDGLYTAPSPAVSYYMELHTYDGSIVASMAKKVALLAAVSAPTDFKCAVWRNTSEVLRAM